MSRPKPRSTKPARSHSGGTLLGIFIGLVIGLVIAAGVVWYLNKTPVPFREDKVSAPETEKNAAAKPAETAKPAQAPQTAAKADSESLPGKPGDKPEKRFTFYDILPGKQEAVPEQPKTPAKAETPAPGAPVEQASAAPVPAGEPVFLQVGAFQKSAEADNLKARLALIGVEASVQEVAIPDKGTLFRVRIGPYGQVEELNRMRSLLAQNGIAASVVKAK
jgi:cell division protein FtsN